MSCNVYTYKLVIIMKNHDQYRILGYEGGNKF